jgi:hypothetical protein
VATLLLTTCDIRARDDAPEPGAERPTLWEWLGKDWAILFSHPDDFVRCELEIDRWLAVVQSAFAGCRIRPLALGSQASAGRASWVWQISRDASTVFLERPLPGDLSELELRARTLHLTISTLQPRRFVMVIDSSLNPRRTFTYSGLSDVPSPLELLGWADAARTHAALTEDSAISHTAHPCAHRHHKHRPGAACRHPAHERRSALASHC